MNMNATKNDTDSILLLREANEGVKMGISSLEDVLGHVKNKDLYAKIKDSLDEHRRLEKELKDELTSRGEDDKDPPAVAERMATVKSNMKMILSDHDKKGAEIIVDGCNMGVKSLSQYLNEYKTADERSKSIAKKLITMESDLSIAMREYL